MVTIAIALLIIAAVAIVAWPFFSETPEADWSATSSPDLALENLVTRRDATYAAIKELESDHAMGKLSDQDYRVMRAKYETRAVGILQELDGLSATQSRPARTYENGEVIEQQVRQLRKNPSCPKCGTPHEPNDAFCAKCGTVLRGARCPSCGTRSVVGDKFCARCGLELKARSNGQVT